jgi:CO/xanthine dehydrogenase Mo-binding subunit
MAEFKIVGRSVPRAEGTDKVSGRTLYAADINLPRTLWGKILRSPYPYARVHRIDATKARKVPGVKAVVTGEDTRELYVGKQIRDMPVLCWDTVRFVGDRVAAVAAQTVDAAEEAIALIEVEYEPLAAVFDPIEAMRSSAPRLHPGVGAYEGGP